MSRYLTIGFVLVLFSTILFAEEEELEVGIVENLNETIPGSIRLLNEDGRTVTLTDIIDKPTVISLVYYRCPGICSPLMDGIANVMDRTDLIPGKDYQVLTISFDPRESIDLALKKKMNYMGLVNKKEAIDTGWTFYVSDSANIAQLTQAVGFRYKQTGNDFLHSGTLIFLSPDGKITRYLNGTQFLPFEFKMALLETSRGQTGPTINKVLQYCYSYDPKGQTYVLNITRVAGTLIMILALAVFLYLVLKPVFSRKLSTN
ncbi:MAG: SCO family protein [Bacteroidota bacterium]